MTLKKNFYLKCDFNFQVKFKKTLKNIVKPSIYSNLMPNNARNEKASKVDLFKSITEVLHKANFFLNVEFS